MSMAIVGTGLVSPFGLCPQDHVFFLRAGIPTPPATPFVDDEDKPVRVNFCRWIGIDAPIGSRMAQLAARAIDQAIGSLELHRRAPHTPLFLCAPGARAGAPASALDELEAALRARYRPSVVRRFVGEAGIFAALGVAEAELDRVPGARITLAAIDSYASLDALVERRKTLSTKWMQAPPHPSEAAAALVLTRQPGDERPLGHVEESVVLSDASNDENDLPAQGSALTAALRKLATSPVHFVFGQVAVDALRRQEWMIACARHPEPFRSGWLDECFESRIGAIGAASGAASIAYGLALLRHDAAPLERPRHAPFLAWAISKNGLRGMAKIRLGAA